jgi:hypothetical protein
VYRAASSERPFTRLTGSAPLLATTFDDNAPTAPSVYMVRAVKLEKSSSGTYFNASEGIFASGLAAGDIPSLALSIEQRDNSLAVVVAGQPGQSVVVDLSENLQDWEFLVEGTTGTAGQFTKVISTGTKQQFYRAHLPH